jgi:hypothetical protein
MSHVSDCMIAKMRTEIQESIAIADDWGSINDIIHLWLSVKLGIPTGSPETIMDLWERYFDSLSIPTGAHNDRYSAWLYSIGYFGALSDQIKDYWCDIFCNVDWSSIGTGWTHSSCREATQDGTGNTSLSEKVGIAEIGSSYKLTGNVSGIAGTILMIIGSDSQSITANGDFTLTFNTVDSADFQIQCGSVGAAGVFINLQMHIIQ